LEQKVDTAVVIRNLRDCAFAEKHYQFVTKVFHIVVVSDRKIIDNNGMTAYTMKDVRKLGIEEVIERAIEHASLK